MMLKKIELKVIIILVIITIILSIAYMDNAINQTLQGYQKVLILN